MTVSPTLALPLLQAAQAQKEITHNEAILLLEAVATGRVESADETSPPPAPVTGSLWIVAVGGSGDWSGWDGYLALWDAGGWRFIPPMEGMQFWVLDQGLLARFDGAIWGLGDVRASQIWVGGDQVIGPRQPAVADPTGGAVVDVQARASLAAICTALRAHGLIAS